MAKAYSQAAKRKAKKAFAELAEVPKKYKSGNHKTPKTSRDPQKAVLEARCRHFGTQPTRENLKAVSAPHMGCQIGMVMEFVISSQTKSGKEEIDRLWSTLCRLGAAYAIYYRRYLGQSGEPACQAIMTAREFNVVLEVESNPSADIRTEREKDDAAVNTYMRWQGRLGQLNTQHFSAIHKARKDDPGLWEDQEPTATGIAALLALRKLREIEG